VVVDERFLEHLSFKVKLVAGHTRKWSFVENRLKGFSFKKPSMLFILVDKGKWSFIGRAAYER